MISIRGRALCRCVVALGVELAAHPDCPRCGASGGVGAELPSAEEEAVIRAGAWRLVDGVWTHPLWGTGRWRGALELARDDARRGAGASPSMTKGR